MRTLANIFLILFLNTALLGIADGLIKRFLDSAYLSALHGFALGLTIFIGLLIYLGFAVNKHLPKRVLVPPLLLLFWGMLNFWPLENILGRDYLLYAAGAQLLLALLALETNRRLNRKSRLLVVSQFAGPGFCGRNLFRFILLNIPLLPIAVLLLGFFTASSLLEEQSAGFMRLKPNGLYMIEKAYRRDGKEIRLVSMIHLAQADFYQQLTGSLSGQSLLVLAEGVSDKEGRLDESFNYQNLARLLGVASQEKLQLPGRIISADSLNIPQPPEEGIDILPADVDLRTFDARTIELLNALGRLVLSNSSPLEGFREFNRWTRQHASAETERIVIRDLLEKRNRHLLSYLPLALKKYDRVVIPWGALHMPGLEAAVQHKGFVLHRQQEHLSIDFLLLPYEQLWENLRSASRPAND